MASFPSYAAFYFARGALSSINLIASFVMWIMSLVKLRTNKDPARTAFLWQRISFGFFSLFCIFDAAYYLWIPFYRNYGYGSTNTISTTLGPLGSLWYNIADILILMALVRLNNGISIVGAKQPTSLPKILKNISWGAFGILLALAIALFATSVAFRLIYIYGYSINLYRLGTAFYALMFVSSVFVLAQTIYVFVVARSESHLAQASIFSLVCAILYFMHQLYELIIVTTLTIEGYYLPITEVVFSLWPMFIILVLIFVLGSRRTSPLYSNSAQQQSAAFMPAPAGAQPAFYTVNGVTYAVQPPVMQQAYMPPQHPPQQAYMPQGAAPEQYQQPYPPQTYQPPPPNQGMYVVPPELSAPNSYGHAGQPQHQDYAAYKAEDHTPSPPSVGGAPPPPAPARVA
ncbi:unnamed protein product [Clonostachys rosea f. rosea IK726]|uniref:Uncharacterized protein n=2 Tax=Bionectria ochroleuca TaxID=29856 RepID=A0ACA9UGU4_BIOOC|nr:unnamed protein product [Clonostachys rosea f. rosea IK726]